MSNATLNAAQTKALETALSGENMWIVGPPGTGKTFLNEFIRQKISANGKVIQMTATTGTAASLMKDGITLHRFTGTGGASLKMHLPIFPEAADTLSNSAKDIIKKTDTLVIDEASMLSKTVLNNLNDFLMRARDNTEEHYGGIQMILVGDICQLPPVEGTLGPGMKREQKVPQTSIFRYTAGWKVCVLSDFVRQAEDPLLQNINMASMATSASIRKQAVKILNAKCLNRPELDYSKAKTEREKDEITVRFAIEEGIPIITPRNLRVSEYIQLEKEILRDSGKKAFTISEPKRLLEFTELTKYQQSSLGYKRGFEIEDRYLLKRRSFETQDLRFYEGQIVQITHNHTDKTGIPFMNGDRCVFISYDPKEEIILVRRIFDGAIIHLPRVKILSEWSDKIGNMGYDAFPLVRALASNIHKNQGQTLDRVIVDVWGLSDWKNPKDIPMMINVAFSRVRRLSDIYLRRFVAPFDVEREGIDEEMTSLWNLSYMKDYPKVDTSVLDAHSA